MRLLLAALAALQIASSVSAIPAALSQLRQQVAADSAVEIATAAPAAPATVPSDHVLYRHSDCYSDYLLVPKNELKVVTTSKITDCTTQCGALPACTAIVTDYSDAKPVNGPQMTYCSLRSTCKVRETSSEDWPLHKAVIIKPKIADPELTPWQGVCQRHSKYHMVSYVGDNDRLVSYHGELPNGGGEGLGRGANYISKIEKNQKLVSQKGRFHLILQDDCNLALYDTQHKPNGGYDSTAMLWSAGTTATGAHSGFQPECYAELNAQGQLTVVRTDGTQRGSPHVYTSAGVAPTSTTILPAYLILQDDGNLVWYQCDQYYFETNTWQAGVADKKLHQ